MTIHPLSRQLQRHALFTTLVKLDSSLNPVPYIARSWSWDTNHRFLTMHLIPNLRWHDGERFTAEDVAFTFSAAADPELGSPRRSDVAIIDRIEVSDSATITIEFNSPQASVPYILAELPIVPKHLLDTVPRTAWRSNRFSIQPVGSGPYRFKSRLAGRRWEFERNDDFPIELGGPPKLKTLVVAVVDEAATKFAGLVSGELDIAGVSPVMAHLVSSDSLLILLTPPVLFSQVLVFNTLKAPLTDLSVRKAISLSIDRTRLVKAAVAGFASPAAGAIPPGLSIDPVSSNQTEDMSSRTQAADSLLTTSGWLRAPGGGVRVKNGMPLRLSLFSVGSSDMALEQLIQADLAARGIDVNIRVIELTSFLAMMRSSSKAEADFDLALTGIPGDIALGYLSAMFDSSQKGGALDYSGFHSHALDSLLMLARNSRVDQRAQAWKAVDRELNSSMPVAWLYHAQGVQGLSRKLKHVVMDLRGELVTVAEWVRQE